MGWIEFIRTRRKLKGEGRGWMSKGKLQLGQKYKKKDLKI